MRNALTSLLRLVVGWGISPRLISGIGIAMLILLRITIGWHFHSEGSDKIRNGNWSAAPFFANAKGPYADHFQELVWDYNGMQRRDNAFIKAWFTEFVTEATDYYSFDPKRKARANAVLATAIKTHKELIASYKDDLIEYDKGMEELKGLKAQADRMEVEGRAGQVASMERDIKGKLKTAMWDVDALISGFETEINLIAAPNQLAVAPPLQLPITPTGSVVDTSIMDKYVPYFDLAIGWMLILGLFTPVASLAAAGFLATVFISQFPPGTGPTSSMYQLIEALACLVLAGTGAGRFAGLDFFLHLFVRRSVAKDASPAKA